MGRRKYNYVGIPTELYRQIEKVIEYRQFGYRTPTEFVVDAVRRRLEELLQQVISSEEPIVEVSVVES